MTGTYPEYLLLQKGIAPPADPHATGVRVYADADGALRSIQSDGTDAELGGGAASGVMVASLTLNDAQIRALVTTPLPIVAAPGAGKIVTPFFSTWFIDCTAGAYTHFAAPTGPFSSSVYLAWDALNNFNDASGPISAANFLGNMRRSFAVMGPLSGNILQLDGPSIAGAVESSNSADVSYGYDDAVLYVVGQNDLTGDFEDGDPANSLTVSVFYTIAQIVPL